MLFLTLFFPVSNWDSPTSKTLTLFCEEKDSQATGRAYEATCAMLSHECGGKLQGEGSPPLFSMMILFLLQSTCTSTLYDTVICGMVWSTLLQYITIQYAP